MRAACLGAALLLLAACNRDGDDQIDAVPAPNAETANNLMTEAERAAANAQSRMERQPRAAETNQGEGR